MTQRDLLDETGVVASKEKIHPAIIAIMRAIGPIAKDQQNKEQKYNFRGVDQVYNACHPHFAEHGVYSTSEVLHAEHREGASAKGTKLTHAILKMRFTYWAEDGSHVHSEVVGEGIDYSGDKASNKAMSAADKYALLQLLKIPTAMIDSDGPPLHDNPDHDRKAPKTDNRRNRVPISLQDFEKLTHDYQQHFGTNLTSEEEKARFVEWIHNTTGRTFNVRSTQEWSRQDLDACLASLDSSIPF